MASDLSGKVIVVTGAGQGEKEEIDRFSQEVEFSTGKLIFFLLRIFNLGIGRDLCERLDGLDAIVYAISRSPEPLAQLKAAHPRINTIQLDVSDWNNTRTRLQKHLKDVKIHGLVNNAGMFLPRTVTEANEQDFDKYALALIYKPLASRTKCRYILIIRLIFFACAKSAEVSVQYSLE